MMRNLDTIHLLAQVFDRSGPQRDLLLDELNDRIERKQLPDAEVIRIANALANALPNERDPAVAESIVNLWGSAFARVGVLDARSGRFFR